MAEHTTNYNLVKPLGTENYDVEDQNGNMDIIDGEMKRLADSASGMDSKFANITVPVNSDGLVPVGSTEHAILIIVSGWTLAINGYAWICSGYATGASRKAVNQIGTGSLLTCTADETGYKIHNGANTAANVHVLYLYNS